MKIAILGTRGIPNSYGGFEQFAEFLSVGLVKKGHSVTVYNTSFHDYTENEFRGVSIRKIFSPEKKIGASANFIYDYLCLKDALKQDFDIIYEAGYHSNAPSYYLLKKQSPIVITNMDGLEWKRSKWNWATRKLIKKLEELAIKKSDYLVSDNIGIQEYYKTQFKKDTFFIAYGADMVHSFNVDNLNPFGLQPFDYFMLIARLEPENNIEMILDGYLESGSEKPFLVIGNKNTKYGKLLQSKYSPKVTFYGGLYDKTALDNLRHFAAFYFHGHSVGGTNPSLLEAMASQSLIAAHDNIFNKSVLNNNALYFANSKDVATLIKTADTANLKYRETFVENNSEEISENYSWNKIIDQHEELFTQLIEWRSK